MNWLTNPTTLMRLCLKVISQEWKSICILNVSVQSWVMGLFFLSIFLVNSNDVCCIGQLYSVDCELFSQSFWCPSFITMRKVILVFTAYWVNKCPVTFRGHHCSLLFGVFASRLHPRFLSSYLLPFPSCVAETCFQDTMPKSRHRVAG